MALTIERQRRGSGEEVSFLAEAFREKHSGRSWQTILYYSHELNDLEYNACEKSLILLGRQEIVKSSACAKTVLRSTEC